MLLFFLFFSCLTGPGSLLPLKELSKNFFKLHSRFSRVSGYLLSMSHVKIALYVEWTTYLSVCVGFGRIVTIPPKCTHLIWAPFYINLFIKHPLTRPNLLWSFEIFVKSPWWASLGCALCWFDYPRYSSKAFK